MAVDSALLDAARPGMAFLRLYRWSPACLSFGRNETAIDRYDRRSICERGLDTVRRPTGGRAVWHDDEVTYAVAGPLELFGSLKATYISVHTMLADALRRFGIDAGLAASTLRTGTLRAGACFATPVGGEVVVDGRKLVGSAQVRERGAFLQHGSIMLGNRQEMLSEIGGGASPGATALQDLVGREVSFGEVAEAIVTAARSAWGGSWQPTRFDAPPALVARYSDERWTWCR